MSEQRSEGRVLVTGGTGSIGSEIVRQLLDRGAERVVVFSRDEIKQFVMKTELDDDRIEFIMGDIRNPDSLGAVFERGPVDAVFHAAAMKHVVACEREPMECALTNITGTQNLVRLAVKYRVPRMVTISTDKAASPTGVMGAAKFITERITLNADALTDGAQAFCCVRFGNVANSRGSVIPIMVARLAAGRDIIVSEPEITRFVMRITDAVRLVLSTAEISRGGELFILKMPAFRLGDLAVVMRDRIASRLGRTAKIVQKGLFTGEKLHEGLLNPVELQHLYENDELYLMAPHGNPPSGFTACKIESYDSSRVRQLGANELEALVIEHLRDRNLLPPG